MKFKKLILSFAIGVTLVLASVVGVVAVNYNKPTKAVDSNREVVIQTSKKAPIKPSYYRYAPNTIKIVNGEDRINYKYTPNKDEEPVEYTQELTKNSAGEYIEDVKASSGNIIAYQYHFGNTMDKVSAVNLKSIDTTGVNVSYFWNSSPMDTSISHTNKTSFEGQTIQPNKSIYLYIIVSPSGDSINIPLSFTPSIVWWYGVPQQVAVRNNLNDEVKNITLVHGQQIEKDSIHVLNLEEYTQVVEDTYMDDNYSTYTESFEYPYYLDDYFYDAGYSQRVDLNKGIPSSCNEIYVRYHNLPLETNRYSLTYTAGSNGEEGTYTINQTMVVIDYNDDYGYDMYSSLPETFILPTRLYTEENGWGRVDICSTTFSTDIYNLRDYSCSTAIKHVSLPYGIKEIPNNLFYYASNLEKVDIPNSVKSIGDGAFEGCSLISVTLPESVKTIGANAFWSNDNLLYINLPSKLTSIGDSAFRYCYRLTSLTLPSTLTTIGSDAFVGCFSLAEIYNLTGKTLTTQSEEYGKVAYYAKVIHTNASAPTTILTIDGVKYYPENENSYIALTVENVKAITSATLHAKTTKINDHAFNDCYNLAQVELPSGVKEIGERAFYGCYSLSTINLNECTSLESVGDYAFSNCQKANISLSGLINLISIAYEAFGNCGKITTLDLTGCSKLETIGNYAFYGCRYLVSINLTGCTSLTTIGNSAFEDTKISSLNLSPCVNLVTIGDNAFRDTALKAVEMSGCVSLTTIDYWAFGSCEQLTSITIPASVTKIGYYAFWRCSKLTSIEFEDTTTWYVTTSITNWNNMTGGIPFDVTTASTNATNFTSTYSDYYWYKL